MEIENEKPLYERLSATQGATNIAGIIFLLSSILCFIVAVIYILKSTQVKFLHELYIFAGIFLFIVTALIIIPGLMFLKFGQNRMARRNGTALNYRFATLRNTLIFLCVIFGIVGIFSFTTGAFIFLEEITRYFRYY